MFVLSKAVMLQSFEQQLPSVPMDLLFLVESFDEVLGKERDLFDRWAGFTVGQANDADVRDLHG